MNTATCILMANLIVLACIPGQFDCYKTKLLDKCGEDRVEDWEDCGDKDCNTCEVVYDRVTECVISETGYRDCIQNDCLGSKYLRACEIIPPGRYRCSLQGVCKELPFIHGEKASGPKCQGSQE